MFNTKGQYAQQFYKTFDRVEATGIWATPQFLELDVLYDGLARIIMFKGMRALQNASGFISSQLPDADLYPVVRFTQPMVGIDNGVIPGAPGRISIETDGSIIITFNAAIYSGVGEGGFLGFVVSYISNPAPTL